MPIEDWYRGPVRYKMAAKNIYVSTKTILRGFWADVDDERRKVKIQLIL